jgi:hypothetical protein
MKELVQAPAFKKEDKTKGTSAIAVWNLGDVPPLELWMIVP